MSDKPKTSAVEEANDEAPLWEPESSAADEKAPTAEAPTDDGGGDATPLWEPESSGASAGAEPKRESAKAFGERTAEGSEQPHRGVVTDSELGAISERSGVPVERLRELAPRFAVLHSESGVTDAFTSGLAGIADTALAGLPQNAYKKLGLSPEEERAVDDIQALDRAKSGAMDFVSDLAGGAVLPGGPVTRAFSGAAKAIRGGEAVVALGRAAAGVAGGAAEGALASGLASAQGEEEAAAKTGAKWGAGLSAISPIVGFFAGRYATKGREAAESRMAQALAKGEEEADRALSDRAADLAPGERDVDDALWSILQRQEARRAIREGRTEELVASLPVDTQRKLFEAKRGQASADPLEDVADVLERAQGDFDYAAGHAPKAGVSMDDVEAMESGRLEGAFRQSRDTDRLKRVARADSDLVDQGTTPWGRVGSRLSDARYRASRMDDRFRTEVEPAVDELSRGVNAAQHDVAEALKQASTAAKATRRATRQGVDQSDIYDALEAHATAADLEKSNLPEPVKEAALAWRRWWDAGLEAANSEGAGIARLEAKEGRAPGYVYNRTVAPAEAVARTADFAEELGFDLGAKLSDDVNAKAAHAIVAKAKADPSSSEASFLKGLSLGDQHLPGDGADVVARLEVALDPTRTTDRLERFARAGMERGGTEIPDWLREKDLGKLAVAWANDVFGHLRTKEPTRKLIQIADALEAAGRTAEAKGLERSYAAESGRWIRDLVADLRGVRADSTWGALKARATGFEASKLREATALDRAADEAADAGHGFREKALRAQAWATRELSNPIRVVSKATANMYTTFLGARPFAAVRNALQFPTMALPELGSSYGFSVGARALKNYAANSAHYRQLLRRDGLTPPEALHDAQAALEEGVSRSLAGSGLNHLTKGMAKVGMFLYQAADHSNRALTAAAADVMAEDALRAVQTLQKGGELDSGARRAAAFVRSLGYGYRKEIGDALRSGDVGAAAGKLRAYMNGKTQLNYNRASMSAYGREMGPLLAMFTKWPTSVGADVADALARRTGDADVDAFRRGQAITKWLWPLGAMGAAEAAIRASGVRESNPISREVLGTSDNPTSGFGSLHPLNSIAPLMDQRFAPPLLAEPIGIANHLRKGESTKAVHKALRLGLSVSPGGMLYSFITNELPLLQNRAPEKDK